MRLQKRKPSTSGARPSLEQVSKQRIFKYVGFLAFTIIAIAFFTSSPHRREAVADLKLFHHAPTHKPPQQKNSTSGDIHWFSDLKWLNPFSTSITFDDDRSVLPPLKARPSIYTFYDAGAEKDENVKAAENNLLLIWRRAWWAQGFRPVVLGRSEAMSHPLYGSLASKKLPAQIESDVLRWLAWAQMGGGILANWLCLPMGARDERLLKSLRQGKYPELTRYDGLSSGLFTGERDDIDRALNEAFKSEHLKDTKALIETLTLKVDKKSSSLAFYDANTIAEKYKAISTELTGYKSRGLNALGDLILSHLHQTFQSRFPEGIAVLTPYPHKAHLITHTAYSLASTLRDCPSSPIESSCPPNQPTCKPCSHGHGPPILTPDAYTNSSSIYTIGTTPHPYTFASLLSRTREITTRHIRRDTARDRWLSVVTQKVLGAKRSGPSRLVGFKESVAGESGAARSFWILDDPQLARKDIEYHFGFTLPTFNVTDDTLPPLPEATVEHKPSRKEKKAKEKDFQLQKDLMGAAKEIVKRKPKRKGKNGVKEMVEAWNLADTEAWRFVRAYRARERVIREKWEQEERKFAGGGEGEAGWRWFDRRRAV